MPWWRGRLRPARPSPPTPSIAKQVKEGRHHIEQAVVAGYRALSYSGPGHDPRTFSPSSK